MRSRKERSEIVKKRPEDRSPYDYSSKYRLVMKVSGGFLRNMLPMLKQLKMLGDMGSSRDVVILDGDLTKDKKHSRFMMDGDGFDSIYDINVDNKTIKSGGCMKLILLRKADEREEERPPRKEDFDNEFDYWKAYRKWQAKNGKGSFSKKKCKSILCIPVELKKAKYTRKYRGPSGKWIYKYDDGHRRTSKRIPVEEKKREDKKSQKKAYDRSDLAKDLKKKFGVNYRVQGANIYLKGTKGKSFALDDVKRWLEKKLLPMGFRAIRHKKQNNGRVYLHTIPFGVVVWLD